jgi:hypothetical protein
MSSPIPFPLPAPPRRPLRVSLSRLPPLNSLRAFVVAARHMSFSKASSELHVTPAAISQQIRQLEEQLGCDLFRRTSRPLALAKEGQACLPGLTEAFEKIVGALEQIDAPHEGGPLTISVAPSFAAKWLVPRLDGFRMLTGALQLRCRQTRMSRRAERCAIQLEEGMGRSVKTKGITFLQDDARRMSPDFDNKWFGHDSAPPVPPPTGGPLLSY